jgi:hypothetical protein
MSPSIASWPATVAKLVHELEMYLERQRSIRAPGDRIAKLLLETETEFKSLDLAVIQQPTKAAVESRGICAASAFV